MPAIETLVEALEKCPPFVPVGCFRWMHHGFRMGYYGPRRGEEVVLPGIFKDLDSALAGLAPLPPDQQHRFKRVATRYAWFMGCTRHLSLIQRAWPSLSPTARGKVMAGIVEGAPLREWESGDSRQAREWLVGAFADLNRVRFDATSATQLFCTAVEKNWQPGWEGVLASSKQWGNGKVERIEPDGCPSVEKWGKQLQGTSNRAIDLCLEMAIREGHVAAAESCLSAGADPNIGIWQLERSSNEPYSALDYAIASPRDSNPDPAMARLLLKAGASPAGTSYGGLNKPLFSALRKQDWDLAEELVRRGASFTGGNPVPPPSRRGAKLISPNDPLAGYRTDELHWVRDRIAPLVSMVDFRDVPSIYKGDGQGGRRRRFLSNFLSGDHIDALLRFEALGMPMVLCPGDVLDAMSSGAYRCLDYLLQKWGDRCQAMFRIRRHMPDFGTARMQHLCRLEPYRSNVLGEFNTHGQTPLELPDGSRIWAYMDAIAAPDHGHGPITPRHVFVLDVKANYRRRSDHVISRGLHLDWRMRPIPGTTREFLIHPEQVKRLLPVIKEINGVFIWTGITLDRLWWLDMPQDWKNRTKKWIEGEAGLQIIALAETRISAQDAANVLTPDRTLDEEELAGYPPEFWPCLRRLADGSIGVAPEWRELDRELTTRYELWARQNKPDLSTFVPDPRLMQWSQWSQVPVEFQPFFVIDPVFGTPTVSFNGNNDYEKAMIRKAIAWNNACFADAFKSLPAGDGD